MPVIEINPDAEIERLKQELEAVQAEVKVYREFLDALRGTWDDNHPDYPGDWERYHAAEQAMFAYGQYPIDEQIPISSGDTKECAVSK